MAESVVDLGWLWSIGHALNDFQGMITRQLSSAMSKISVSRSTPPGISIHIWHGDSKGSFAYFEMAG
jgi:hypothetical protein